MNKTQKTEFETKLEKLAREEKEVRAKIAEMEDKVAAAQRLERRGKTPKDGEDSFTLKRELRQLSRPF